MSDDPQVPAKPDPLLEQALRETRQLVADVRAGRFVDATGVLDLLVGYRLFLGRYPEATDDDALASRLREFPAARDLWLMFLSSNEFKQRYHGISERADGRIVLVRDGDLRVAVHLFDRSVGWAIINGIHEPAVRWAIEHLVEPGMTCVDLGANVGLFTAVMAQRVGPRGRVVAYEPYPVAREMLEITLAESRLADRVCVRASACSDAADTVFLCFSRETDHYAGQFIVNSKADAPAGFEVAEVEAVTLDGDLADCTRIDFIKIDIEGAELKALRGMRGRLTVDHPVVVMELNEANLARHGAHPSDVMAELRGAGYRVFDLEALHAGRVEEIAGWAPGCGENVLCLSGRSADERIRSLAGA